MNTKDFPLIKQVLDKYFDFIKELGDNTWLTEAIPPAMLGPQSEKIKEVSYWMPIPSTVTNDDIRQLEAIYKHPIPAPFQYFLQYRHFLELDLGLQSIRFFENRPQSVPTIFEMAINKFYQPLVQQNFLPFANVHDEGILCFDANQPAAMNDYPIVSFEHQDDYQQPAHYADTFVDMFMEFDTHLSRWITNNRALRNTK